MTVRHRGLRRLPRLLSSTCALVALATPAMAQSDEGGDPIVLPTVSVEAAALGESLTVPTTEEARQLIEFTPGAVEIVPDTAWQDTPATTLKDVLDYVPGVFVQPKWGEDSRLSIRGSGLSRNFHMRGIQLLTDGIPFNASDGSADFQEIDPTAYRYVEVYKGANGLRYGANGLGGAINFVSPTGYDAELAEGRVDFGSFGFQRYQASAGGVLGDVDGFLTGSWLSQDGFRDHSAGDAFRGNANVGWRITDNIETRFFLNGSDIWQQIPGTVTKEQALNDPKAANPSNLALDYQRNMQVFRVANKTTIALDNNLIEFGGYATHKDLQHPIYQYLDYEYHDYGGFARLTNESDYKGHANRFVLGLNLAGGWVDNTQYANIAGDRGALLSQSKDSSFTQVVYGENSFELVPDLSFILGLQYVATSRKREDQLPAPPDTSGDNHYTFFNPKAGLLWQGGPDWQVFGNVSRSGEAPTFGEINFTNSLSDIKAQRATTVEVGTRGSVDEVSWDLAFYRAAIRNEFQFFDLGGGNYQVSNADRTLHQGIEAGLGWGFAEGLLDDGPLPDRLSLNLAYTFSDFRFVDDPEWGDNQLPGAPRHYMRAELLYQHPAGLYAGPNLEWVPKAYYVDNANTLDTKPYALLGLQVGYEHPDGWFSLYLDARNLTNEHYISSTSVVAVANANSAVFEPGTGRAIFGGVRLHW